MYVVPKWKKKRGQKLCCFTYWLKWITLTKSTLDPCWHRQKAGVCLHPKKWERRDVNWWKATLIEGLSIFLLRKQPRHSLSLSVPHTGSISSNLSAQHKAQISWSVAAQQVGQLFSYWWLGRLFALLGSAHVKAASKYVYEIDPSLSLFPFIVKYKASKIRR